MPAGKFDRRIRIDTPLQYQESSGAPAEEWQLWREVWAELVIVGGGEGMTNGQRYAQQTVQFRIRATPGVDPSMSIVFQGKRYRIEDVGQPDRNKTLVLTCTVLDNHSGE